jgi:hypothetical protein
MGRSLRSEEEKKTQAKEEDDDDVDELEAEE